MKKIWEWLTKWPKDKVLHFTLSLIIAIIAATVAKVCGGNKFAVLASAWFAGFMAGVWKEIYDEAKSGSSEESDWAADVIGTTLGTLIAFILVC